ncbi:unnamed protein product [Symbiodinium natans]|uniref:Uncharacterized protein n=1 Tax=Symbiodinium natans TaxID=878477 RepID=A0A812MGJ3_9DINO|nr:unnamed protein product [Symbiodinium natans]
MTQITPMSLRGEWKELETSNIYTVTAPDDPLLSFLTVVNNPAKGDRREYEVKSGPEGQIQLQPLFHKDTTGTDTLSDLFLDYSVPGRIIWYSYTTGKHKTWQYMLQVWNTTVVQLTPEAEDAAFRLVMRKLTGDLIAKVTVEPGTNWRDARKLMVPGLRPLLSKKLAFVSPLGEVLTQAHDQRPLSDILGCEVAEPSEPRVVEEWRRFQ